MRKDARCILYAQKGAAKGASTSPSTDVPDCPITLLTKHARPVQPLCGSSLISYNAHALPSTASLYDHGLVRHASLQGSSCSAYMRSASRTVQVYKASYLIIADRHAVMDEVADSSDRLVPHCFGLLCSLLCPYYLCFHALCSCPGARWHPALPENGIPRYYLRPSISYTLITQELCSCILETLVSI